MFVGIAVEETGGGGDEVVFSCEGLRYVAVVDNRTQGCDVTRTRNVPFTATSHIKAMASLSVCRWTGRAGGVLVVFFRELVLLWLTSSTQMSHTA